MTLFITLDKNGGVAFNSRRQSRDRFVVSDILSSCGGGVLRVSPYSSALFSENDRIYSGEDWLSGAKKGDFVFSEKLSLTGIEDKVSRIYVYSWETVYPADTFIGIDFSRFSLLSEGSFPGFAHDIIVKKFYRYDVDTADGVV